MSNQTLTRRTLLAGACSVAAAPAFALKPRKVPVGLELYSVRGELARDLTSTVTRVAEMGYEVVEFYAPYASWTTDYAKTVRALLDSLHIKCLSTHNNSSNLQGDGLKKAIELNHIIGSSTLVMASSGRTETRDDWKRVADALVAADAVLKPLKMRAGYHNHQLEFTVKDGFRPLEIIADNTPKSVTMQLDVGTCLEVGSDPVEWVKKHPGRIRSMHLKDWSKAGGYSVLFGEGDAPWKALLDAALSHGGAEYVLIEQEGSRFPELETAQRCLKQYRDLLGG